MVQWEREHRDGSVGDSYDGGNVKAGDGSGEKAFFSAATSESVKPSIRQENWEMFAVEGWILLTVDGFLEAGNAVNILKRRKRWSSDLLSNSANTDECFSMRGGAAYSECHTAVIKSSQGAFAGAPLSSVVWGGKVIQWSPCCAFWTRSSLEVEEPEAWEPLHRADDADEVVDPFEESDCRLQVAVITCLETETDLQHVAFWRHYGKMLTVSRIL